MPRLERRRLEALLAAFSGARVLVVGDVILDEHLWGDVERVSPEAPVPVVHVARESLSLGGAGNVVRNVVALGARCEFCGVVGDDDAGARVEALLKETGASLAGLVVVPGRPTTWKTRVIARQQQVVRFDRETEEPVPPAAARSLLRAVESALAVCDAVILEDYGKGVLTRRVAQAVIAAARARGAPVCVDPKGDLAIFRGATLLKPNLREAEALAGFRARTPADLARAVAKLRRVVGASEVVVTRGADGMTIFDGKGPGIDVHTAAREVFDVQGAGDTTIAALALARRAGASLLEAAVIANAAAGVVVGKLGTATATRNEVKALLPAAIAAAQVPA
jgi:D-beta-D-heptose 7-phosphate kinase/D-beta-D-heptose 1-phosphate adenosyltransferase